MSELMSIDDLIATVQEVVDNTDARPYIGHLQDKLAAHLKEVREYFDAQETPEQEGERMFVEGYRLPQLWGECSPQNYPSFEQVVLAFMNAHTKDELVVERTRHLLGETEDLMLKLKSVSTEETQDGAAT